MNTPLKFALYSAAIVALISSVPAIINERTSVVFSGMIVMYAASCLRDPKSPSWIGWTVVVMAVGVVTLNMGVLDYRWWRVMNAVVWLVFSTFFLVYIVKIRKRPPGEVLTP